MLLLINRRAREGMPMLTLLLHAVELEHEDEFKQTFGRLLLALEQRSQVCAHTERVACVSHCGSCDLIDGTTPTVCLDRGRCVVDSSGTPPIWWDFCDRAASHPCASWLLTPTRPQGARSFACSGTQSPLLLQNTTPAP